MAKRDETKQLYYRETEAAYRQGLIKEKQYNLIMQALADDMYQVEYKSRPKPGGGIEAKWTITTVGAVD